MSYKPTLGSLKDLIRPPKTTKKQVVKETIIEPVAQQPLKKEVKAKSRTIKNALEEHQVTASVPVSNCTTETISERQETSNTVQFHTKTVPAKKNSISTKEIRNSSRSSSKSEKKTKIGTYASAEFQNWLNTPIQKPKIKRSKKTNDDAFQVFQDFSDMVENQDWKTFFSKLYTGKFPHGYSYRNQTVFFRKRTKIEKLEILDSSRSTMSKVMHFFTAYGGYANEKDDLNIFDFVVSQTPQFESWKDIRSKKSKQFFIQKYVEDLTDMYQLNEVEKRVLVDTIHTGFLLKIIDNADIEFANKRITDIKTLKWNEQLREFELPRLSKTSKLSRKTCTEKVQRNSFSTHWNKFVNHILKNKTISDDIPTDASTALEDLTDTITDTFTDTTALSLSVVSEI